jgi:ferredoxin
VLSYELSAIKNNSIFLLKRRKGLSPMAYVISKDDCIQCGACEAECPDGAISEIDGYYVIDATKCKDCGSCSDVCPNGAISQA